MARTKHTARKKKAKPVPAAPLGVEKKPLKKKAAKPKNSANPAAQKKPEVLLVSRSTGLVLQHHRITAGPIEQAVQEAKGAAGPTAQQGPATAPAVEQAGAKSARPAVVTRSRRRKAAGAAGAAQHQSVPGSPVKKAQAAGVAGIGSPASAAKPESGAKPEAKQEQAAGPAAPAVDAGERAPLFCEVGLPRAGANGGGGGRHKQGRKQRARNHRQKHAGKAAAGGGGGAAAAVRDALKREQAQQLLEELLRTAAGAGEPEEDRFEQLQEVLGYTFTDRRLLEQALTHPSAQMLSNKRLNWLGDAVLQLVTSEMIYCARPGAMPLELTNARALLVPRKTCAALGRALGIPELLVHRVNHGRLGVQPGPHGGAATDDMVAEAFEGLLGAVFLDCGGQMEVVKQVYAAAAKCTKAGE